MKIHSQVKIFSSFSSVKGHQFEALEKEINDFIEVVKTGTGVCNIIKTNYQASDYMASCVLTFEACEPANKVAEIWKYFLSTGKIYDVNGTCIIKQTEE